MYKPTTDPSYGYKYGKDYYYGYGSKDSGNQQDDRTTVPTSFSTYKPTINPSYVYAPSRVSDIQRG